MEHGLRKADHEVDLFFVDRRNPWELPELSREYDSVIVCKGTQIRDLSQYEDIISKLHDTTYFIPDVVGKGSRATVVGPRGMACTRIVCTGTEATKWYRENGYRGRIAQIYQGYRAHIWKPGDAPRTGQKHLSFLGSFYKGDGGREARINLLRKHGFTVLYRNNLFHEQAASVYWNSAICLNFSSWDCTSNRVIRIMASGGFLLTEGNRDVEASFERGNQLDWFTSTNELLEKVKFYVQNPELRHQIAERGHNWAKDKSWTEQMGKVVRFIQGEEFCDGAAKEYIGGI